MSRWKAASIHFSLSIVVLSLLAGLLAATWYPPEYIPATGGLGLIGILAGVDACLGPLLTLIIFKAQKPGLKFDLTVIAALQMLALGYGLLTIYQARPVYLAFAKDRFELVFAYEIPPENLAAASLEAYRSLPLTGPRIVAVQPPTDPQEREKILFSALSGGLDIQHFPKFYRPYEELRATVLDKAQPLDILLRRNATARQLLTEFMSGHDLESAKLKFLPMRSRIKDQTVLIDGASAEVLGIVDVAPW